MEPFIQISKINDFLYSPKSLYLHSIYESFSQNVYHEAPQKTGKLNHQNIEKGKYSSARRYMQGIPIYSEKYNIGGKIDVYDRELKVVIERKTRIKRVYEGHIMQLYAQMFCLEEMGYPVARLCIHSLADNKRHNVTMPGEYEKRRFSELLEEIRRYDATLDDPAGYRCDASIYRHLSF